MSNKQEVFNILKQKGLPSNAIAGIMANIDVETGGSFDYLQKQIKGPGRGLFQLDPTGPLPRAYAKWREENDVADSAEAQIEFMLDTIYGGNQEVIGYGHAEKLRKAFEEGTAEDIAVEFSNRWERPSKPHLDRRKASASRLLEELGTQEQPKQREQKETSYTIQPGDTLFQIAAERGLNMEDLMRANGIMDANRIQAGQELVMPGVSEEEDGLVDTLKDAYDYGKSTIASLFR